MLEKEEKSLEEYTTDCHSSDSDYVDPETKK